MLDEAPLDIERVVSGVVTGTRQAELSHLNVRSAARGTPNCYLAGAQDQLRAWEGQLVQFCCGADGIEIRTATQDEAEAWWESIRPEPVEIVEPDFSVEDLVGLLDLPTSSATEREAGVAAYGSKGTNLATLYQRIDAELQLEGLLVPMSAYQAHLDDNGIGIGGDLEDLRAAIEQAPKDPELVLDLYDAILEVYGDDTTMVRFRSSSNAEDAVGFSGAGLYDSESVCAADSFDGDDLGPSLCDPDQDEERTIEAGLGSVWASLWTERAVEERAWYGIDDDDVAMAILVNTRSEDEQANIVAFTGIPGYSSDDRYMVESQIGELDVVSNRSGTWPERVLLQLDGGEVVDIDRVSASTEVDVVLEDAALEELGSNLWDIEQIFPVDGSAEGRVLLDTEWKVLADGQLVVKQVRPFLD